ncbi:ATP-grasp fold amidoligase family protein [Streptococcus porci]|uniref:ATP-grasp fold amidoligase family protein n=1 Tax=Streptococcus porci TaxID=502567 RepID=UPI0009FD1E57|nr:ATP-grasp fold amidoligase family protein [Streptococcus porci]
MNGYKNLIRNQKMRFTILRLLKFIPDRIMLKIQYRIKLKRKLDLNNPKRYTEKIQWYKLYYRNPVMMECVDKYSVRNYIHRKGLDDTLNKLYQVVNSPDDIDFSKLPAKFIIKTTNGSGTNIIVKDKSKLDIEKTKRELSDFLQMAEASAGREWAYGGSSKKIIIEELLEDTSNEDNGISDYKFLCFNGKPEYVVYDKDRFSNHKRNFYDMEWNYIKVDSDCPCFEDSVEKPANFDEMIKVAEILSSDFPAVRVDLYNIKGRVVFGELTFYPWSGYVQYDPDSFDFDLGKKFILPNKRMQ